MTNTRMVASIEASMALSEQHRSFLDKVRYGFDKENDWDDFYNAFLESIETLLPHDFWTLSAVRKFLPTLREEISNDLYTGYENGVLVVLIVRRIQTYIEAIRRWAIVHKAANANDYDYVTTAYLALHSLYRDGSKPAWVHDVLSEALRIGRVRLEKEKHLDSFLNTFARSMTRIRRVALDDDEGSWWNIHLRVHVRLYQVLYGDELTLRHGGLRNPVIRRDIVTIFRENDNDRVTFPLIMDRIRKALEVDGVPLRLKNPVPMVLTAEKKSNQ